MDQVNEKRQPYFLGTFRTPNVEDARAIRQIVEESGVLDLNSLYSYLLLCQHFAETCIVTEIHGKIVGFTTGYRPPTAPEVLFVWQIGVAEAMRGQGLASSMLKKLLERKSCCGISFLEATVTPSNQPSRALFQSLARDLGAEYIEKPHFGKALFGSEGHEQENLLRVGPFKQGISQGGDNHDRT